MKEPVMISSGVTYDKQSIVRYFEQKRRTADPDDSNFDEESHFLCPVTNLSVEPDKIMANKRIAAAT